MCLIANIENMVPEEKKQFFVIETTNKENVSNLKEEYRACSWHWIYLVNELLMFYRHLDIY